MKFVFLQCILPSIFSRLFADRIPEAIRPRGARLRSSLVSRFVSQILKRVSILLSILTVDFNDIFFFGSLIFDFFPPFFFVLLLLPHAPSELAALPDAVLFEPWRASPPPRNYPAPICDHSVVVERNKTSMAAAFARVDATRCTSNVPISEPFSDDEDDADNEKTASSSSTAKRRKTSTN